MNSEFNPRDHSRSGPSLKSGTIVSHYRIIRHIGTGGMGEVYAADDLSLKRKVALKILLPVLAADASLRHRFETEADSMASINHPNVAVIHEIGQHDERPYLIMEYIEGRSLVDILAEAPLNVDTVVDLAGQMCDGLAAIHGAGLIHRDIKPSNILVDTTGRARIIDFGVVRIVDDQHINGTLTITGTIGYMSPEQIRGESLTEASDLFSLGVILYRMLTGQNPFKADYQAAMQYEVINSDPEPILSICPDLPESICSAVMQLLEKKPTSRFADAVATRHALLQSASPKTADSPDHTSRHFGGSRMLRITSFSLLIIIMAAITIWIFSSPHDSKKSPTTLAVLPFENLGSPEDEYFADGMTIAVITRLTRLGDLRVISRRSSVGYKDSDLSFSEIGKELGVGYILTGSIFWDKSVIPNQFRINTQLVRTSDETYVWGEDYERTRQQIISLQSDIAEQVATVLRIALSEAERQSIMAVPTDNLEAYDYFLRGLHYFNQSWDQGDILNATDMFQRAVEADSNFALAYAMLSRGHESMFWEYIDRSEDRCHLARQAASKALELQPQLIEGYLARGYIFYHCEQKYDRALEEFRLALAGGSDHADLYSAIAAVQRRQGKHLAAVDNFKISFTLDPRSHLKAFDVALTYGLMRRFDDAEPYLDNSLILAPNVPLTYVYKAWTQIFRSGDTTAAQKTLNQATGRADIASSRYYWWLSRIVQSDYRKTLSITRPGSDTAGFLLHHARLYRLMKQKDDEYRCSDSARRILESRIVQYPDDPRFHSQLGLAHAGLQNKAEAIAHGQEALELLPYSRDAFDPLFFMINLAEILVVVGETEAALDQLERLMSIPGFISVPYLRLDPLWEPLRTHPRYQKLQKNQTEI